MSESDNPDSGSSEQAALPPASFEFLVFSLKMQAEIQLGLLTFGDEEKQPKPNLPLGRHTIDLLNMLAEKTKGNLTPDEQRLLEISLTEMRFRYVQAVEESRKGAGGDAPA